MLYSKFWKWEVFQSYKCVRCNYTYWRYIYLLTFVYIHFYTFLTSPKYSAWLTFLMISAFLSKEMLTKQENYPLPLQACLQRSSILFWWTFSCWFTGLSSFQCSPERLVYKAGCPWRAPSKVSSHSCPLYICLLIISKPFWGATVRLTYYQGLLKGAY